MTSLRLFMVFSALALFCLCSSPAVANMLNVPDDYPTIQSAINAALDGDTVVVAVGTYPENINFLGKAITVQSTNPDDEAVVAASIIDGQQLGSVVTFNHGEGAGSVLTGLTITNGRASFGGGVYCLSSSPTITKNTITANSADRLNWSRGGGIACDQYSSPTIRGNTITDNFASGAGGGGICCMNSSSAEISENIVSGNAANGGGGISCRDFSSPDITGNTISKNSSNWNGGAISARGGSAPLIRGNCFIENTVLNWGAGGVFVEYAGAVPVAIEDNVFIGNKGGGEPLGQHGSPIHVIGGCASIKRNVIRENVSGRHGGGILCHHVTDADIMGNLIEDNRSWHGGGIGVYSPTGLVRIEDNQVRSNDAVFAGALHLTNGAFTVEGNEITDNLAYAFCGGIAVESADATIRSNTIERNTDVGLAGQGFVGGIYCHTSRVAILENTIASNAGVGVNVWAGTGVTIGQNSIVANDGLGIDLRAGPGDFLDGPTPNDPGDTDTGANNLQNFPVILSATGNGSSTTIDGYLDSTPNTEFTLDFYANMEPDPSGYGEGETPIGSTAVTTGNDGIAQFNVTFPVGVQRPALTTATATDPEGNTSEFSAVYVTVLAIDIKPGSDPNSINLGAEGVVPVAILSTPDFDAASVDASSLVLSGSEVRLKGKSGNAGSLEDVDGDGDLDLVVQFYIDQLALQEGSTEAALGGSLLDGITPIVGYDAVNVVP